MTQSSPIVVDASVAVKWVVSETLSDQATALLATALAQPLFVPPHFYGEVANALHRRTMRTTPTALTPIEARAALNQFLSLSGIDVITPRDLYRRGFTLAQTLRVGAVYDSLYVAAAELIGGEFWTADQNFVDVVASQAPWVRWLGTYPLPNPEASDSYARVAYFPMPRRRAVSVGSWVQVVRSTATP
jgi:predicted nucleic acid-binding protein